MDDFNTNDTLETIRTNRKISRRKAYRKSKLEKYRVELVQMSNCDGSLVELQSWLRSLKQMTVARSTIYRYLHSLPEAHKYGDNNNG